MFTTFKKISYLSNENLSLNLTVWVSGIKVLCNAGGVNPEACAAALKSVCSAANIDLNIAVVSGDDIMNQVSNSTSLIV